MKKDLNNVILRPHITEKATITSEKSVYVFVVDAKSTKSLIGKAFEGRYKLTPVKVATVTIPAKNVFVRGKKGSKAGYKKAYIYLKPGTKIENL
jgi:large subunit ribosomal protein L23